MEKFAFLDVTIALRASQALKEDGAIKEVDYTKDPLKTESTLNALLSQKLQSLPKKEQTMMANLIQDSYGIDPEDVFKRPIDNLIILEAVFRRKQVLSPSDLS